MALRTLMLCFVHSGVKPRLFQVMQRGIMPWETEAEARWSSSLRSENRQGLRCLNWFVFVFSLLPVEIREIHALPPRMAQGIEGNMTKGRLREPASVTMCMLVLKESHSTCYTLLQAFKQYTVTRINWRRQKVAHGYQRFLLQWGYSPRIKM